MKSNKKFLVFVFSVFMLIVQTNFAQSSADTLLNEKTRNFDQKNVKLELQFNFTDQSVAGKEEFTFAPLVDNFQKLILHCRTTTVYSVVLNHEDLKYSDDGNYLIIQLDKPYPKDKNITVSITYVSHPTLGLFFFLPTKAIPQIPYQIWSQGEGIGNRYWYPAYDLPDDKLTSEITAIVPDSLKVISNGSLISIINNVNNKTTTYDWRMDQPHSNYLTSIIVGKFQTIKEDIKGIELDYNVINKWAGKVDYYYGHTPQMINFYSNYLVKYPYLRYAQTAVQDFAFGGMENITATTLNQRLYHDESAEPNYSSDGLIAHELAHQWFGDDVTCKTFNDIWLNEGFATYMTDLWFENYYGEDEFRYRRYTQNEEYFNNQLKNEPLDSIKLLPDHTIPIEMRGSKAYQKGAAILNTLRFYMGDKLFQLGLRHYLEKYKFNAASTKDLENAMSEESGKDLSRFFNEWIYSAGFPVFKVSDSWDSNTEKLKLDVDQVQKMLPAVGLFHIPVLVEITIPDKTFLDTINISEKENTFEINCPQKPLMVRFNKYLHVLCRVQFEKPFEDLVYQLKYDDDVTGRITAAKELIKFGKKSIPYLKSVLIRDNFYGMRLQAIESLKEIGGEETLNPLLLASNDLDGRVREEAVRSLSSFNEKQVGHFLLDKFNDETNVYVKGAAAYTIGALKMKNAFNILKEALKLDSHRNIIRRDVFDGLSILGDARALDLAEEYLKYKYSYGGMHLLDISILKCVMKFKDANKKKVIDIVSQALQNPYFRTRNYAAYLLVDLKAKERLPLIKEVLSKDHRAFTKNALKNAVKKLEDINNK